MWEDILVLSQDLSHSVLKPQSSWSSPFARVSFDQQTLKKCCQNTKSGREPEGLSNLLMLIIYWRRVAGRSLSPAESLSTVTNRETYLAKTPWPGSEPMNLLLKYRETKTTGKPEATLQDVRERERKLVVQELYFNPSTYARQNKSLDHKSPVLPELEKQ